MGLIVTKENNNITQPYLCKKFSGKAQRFMAALHDLPYARVMELLPAFFPLPNKKEVMLDLFAGSGFASRFFFFLIL